MRLGNPSMMNTLRGLFWATATGRHRLPNRPRRSGPWAHRPVQGAFGEILSRAGDAGLTRHPGDVIAWRQVTDTDDVDTEQPFRWKPVTPLTDSRGVISSFRMSSPEPAAVSLDLGG